MSKTLKKFNHRGRRRVCPISFSVVKIFLFILLSSCHHASTNWQIDRMTAGTAEHNSTRLSYKTRDKVSGIDLEFLKTKLSLHAYLNVHSVPIPENAKGFLIIDGACRPLEAHVRKGGQRILLSDSTCDLLIQSLLAGKSVEIRLSSYHTTFSPNGFKSQFETMQNFPITRNPFHHPF